MKKNLIITENQFEVIVNNLLITEKLGVPENILDSAAILYDIIEQYLRGLNYESEEYMYATNVDLQIEDITLKRLELDVKTNVFDSYEGKAELVSVGVGSRFRFDNKILMKIIEDSNKIELTLSFGVSKNWVVSELYDRFTKDRVDTESILAHELKHRFDKFKKTQDLIGRDAEYQSLISGLDFGIPVISEFIRYSYFIQQAENLVRPVELASRMKQTNVTKDDFRNFLENDGVYKELLQIKNFSFEHLINQLKEQIDDIDGLLDHLNINTDNMNDSGKIKKVLEIVYNNLANEKINIFDKFTMDPLDGLFGSIFGGDYSEKGSPKENVRRKFINHVAKYEGREVQFFKDECERFNYVATGMIKKIGKLYDMAKDNTEMNESIINWDLHQQLMEKKYGRKKIETKLKFKKK
jgi:hypothetical protein